MHGHQEAVAGAVRTQAELAAPVYNGVQSSLALHQIRQVHLGQQCAQLRLRDDIPAGGCASA